MKRLLPILSLVFFLNSCNKTPSPKETTQEFITALSSSDLSTASTLVSTDTKVVLDKAKKQTQQTLKPEESFHLSTLTETTSGSTAEVKNDLIALPLVKESDGWKIVLSETLLNEIQGREEMLATAKTKWDDLLKEYEARLQVLRQYVNYKKTQGTTSANTQKLGEAINKISPQKEWTATTIQDYALKQNELNKFIDNGLEPSLAANTDLSLNYFLQISNAGDRIKTAEESYQSIAEKAHSPIYKPLPFLAGPTTKPKKQ